MVQLKRILALVICAAILATPLLAGRAVLAASAILYLSPSSTTIAKDSILSVEVREDSSTQEINAAEVHLTYPTDKLDFVSTTSSSAFAVVAADSGGAGEITIERGAVPALSGDQLIATIRFRAKVSAGSANVSVGQESKLISKSDNQNVLATTAGGTYKFRAANSSTAGDKIPPKISNVSVVNITTTSAEVIWTTTEPATSEVVYGESTGYGLAAADSQLATDHKIPLSTALLSAGQTYHYMVKSVDSSGNAVSSADYTFSMKGYPLDVAVVNTSDKPISGAKVSLAGKMGTTDKQGKVTIGDLPVGKLSGFVDYRGKKTPVSVTVKQPSSDTDRQAVTLKIDTGPGNWLAFGLFMLAMLLLAAGLTRLIKRRGGFRRPKAPSPPSSSTPPSTPPNTVIKPSGKA